MKRCQKCGSLNMEQWSECFDCHENLPPASTCSLLHEQRELIIELIEDDIRKHSVKAINPMVQAWADGRVELAKETLATFIENDQAES